MKKLLVLLAFCTAIPASATDEFPIKPDPSLTPGSLCARPTERRYPEGIAYCKRSVGSSLKKEIIRTYDGKLGFRVGQMDRGAFKIDHYYPLCAGGSNDDDNLWPQHSSVYAITDPVEQYACEALAKGKIKQAEALSIVKRVKADLSAAPELLRYVQGLR